MIAGCSLDHDAPNTFREEAAHRLPWTQTPEETLALFVPVLKREKEDCVIKALLRGLRALGE